MIVKRLLGIPLAVVLATIVALVGGGIFLSASHTGPGDGTFHACVDQEGELRLLGPQIKGDFNTRCKAKETLIEFPSSQRLAVLEAGLSGLQSRVSGVETILSALERRVSALEAKAPPPSCDCVLWLKMDEGSGSVAFDSSGLGNHGTIFGARWTPQGLSFDGVDDYVSVADSASLRPTSYTISVWFNWNNVGTDNVNFITGKSKTHYELHTGGAPGVNGLRFIPAGTANILDATSVIHGGWNNVAVVYTGTNAYIYLDGILKASRTITNPEDLTLDTSAFLIGRRAGATPWVFSGLIGEVYMYNRALTSLEIQRNYLATRWKYQ